jgi:hypothetical protein
MRKTETLDRGEFFGVCPPELIEPLRDELNQWEGGEPCKRVEYTTDSLGRIDSESSPRPA